ncbi:histone-lysine N-methyltransferase SETDB2 [Paroedura picta]|uniref:histone-lysine N-methyltransferase SETDB2 n=1 Tax=Paroedura picta TaxID=143630 RepID=UPI0040566D9C
MSVEICSSRLWPPARGEPGTMEVDARTLWRRLGDRGVDLVFEQLQKVVLALKQKIKDETATEEECFQALTLVTQADLRAFLVPLLNVNSVEEDPQASELGLPPPASAEATGSPEDNASLRARKEVASPKGTEDPVGAADVPSRLPFQLHACSRDCLVTRPWSSYKGENPLILPLLCRFERRHAKTDLPAKTLDVTYRAPCRRSLRNFEEVQDYLLQTECGFLLLEHFSFNTYVQVFRNFPTRKGFVSDYDISKGAEMTPISFCNEVDHERLPYFKYRRTSWPRGLFLNNFSSAFDVSCNCTDGCRDATKCACRILTQRSCSETSASPGKETSCGYKHKRLDGPVSSGIYECNLSCSCDKMMCQNRVVQHGLQVRLQVFNTEKKGWGVRCLDDIDRGTFVCTYAGRLMTRAESRQVKVGSHEAKEEDPEQGDGSHASPSKKRKVDLACSDSEIEFVQTSQDSGEPLPVEAASQPNVIQTYKYNDRNWSNEGIKRPQTRTSILQSHRRKLGIADASSSEEEGPACHSSVRRRPIVGTMKGGKKSGLQGELREQATTGPSEAKAAHLSKSPLSNPSSPCKRVGQDKGSAEKQPGSISRTDGASEGDGESRVQEVACEDGAKLKESGLKQFDREDLCLLDATREGNVGRFFNHSCCPNLFVQSVFVETHNRNFPWVAFFTSRHIKAGTELTWDYGYLPGSMPETEIPCQCGSQKCRKKILEFGGTTKRMAKMLRRQCAFCPEDEECSIMYVAEGQNLAVHQDCLLYSSGFVESEEHNPENLDIRFDVTSVVNELKRGRRLICNFCRKKGATVGCEVKHCRRSYHYFCALCDDAAIETDEVQGVYRVFCPNHDPDRKANLFDEDNKRERSPITVQSSSARKTMSEKEKIAEESLQALKQKQDRQKVRVEFLRKCKRAGLLDEIFEEMLDTLHLAQEKLMDDNTPDAEYEETVISLFDCGLFENILTNAHSGTEGKIQELLETRKRLDTQIELLKDLKVVLPAPEDATNCTSE